MPSKFVGYDPCPRCRSNGRDRRGDNLGRYDDGSAHCFSCGYHIHPKRFVPKVKTDGNENKAVLPRDFTREVPAAGWKWLLQYGLPYTYWKPYTGYSPAEERLILTVGDGPRFSQGRYVGAEGHRKWKFYGDGHGFVDVLGNTSSADSAVVVVEDLISQHKVAQVTPSISLFGTNLHDIAMRSLIALKRPVVLWLDGDQYPLLAPKINRLQTFLRAPVRYIRTDKDPKEFKLEEINEILSR